MNKMSSVIISVMAYCIFLTFLIIVFLLFHIGLGLSGWSYELPNGSEIVRSSSRSITIIFKDSPTQYGGKQNIISIPAQILQFCFNDKYICTRNILPDDISEDRSVMESDIVYYILNTEDQKVSGPIDKNEYIALIAQFSIQNLSEWIPARASKIDKHGNVTEFYSEDDRI